MATYKSSVFNQGTRIRPDAQFDCEEVTISLTVPAGKALASGDILRFGKIGENIRALEFEVDVNGSLAASGLTAKWGTSASDACFLALAAFGNGAAAIEKVVDGESAGTNADNFAVSPYVPQTSVVDLIGTIGGTIVSPVSNVDRIFTVRLRYQYAYPDQYVSGVSNSAYPFSGSKVTSNAITMDYNGNAP